MGVVSRGQPSWVTRALKQKDRALVFQAPRQRRAVGKYSCDRDIFHNIPTSFKNFVENNRWLCKNNQCSCKNTRGVMGNKE